MESARCDPDPRGAKKSLKCATGYRIEERRRHEGVRSLGAVKRCPFTAGNGWEGPQPSRPLPIIVATNEWSLLADPLEGVRSAGAVKGCPFTAGNGCEGGRAIVC